MNSMENRMDRRLAFTRQQIKDALLELMRNRPFEKISISGICAQAQVSRSTFYAHYDSLDEVLNELVEEAFEISAYASTSMNLNTVQTTYYLLQFDTVEKLRAHSGDLPPCQRIADDPKYRVLFLDPGLSEYIQNKLYLLNKDHSVPDLMEYCHISEEEARHLFRYLLSGAYTINAAHGWVKDDAWYAMRIQIARLEAAGLDALREANSIHSA